MSISPSGGQGKSPMGAHVYVELKESEASFLKIRDKSGRRQGHGQFNLELNITALQGAVHIPLSIASGKKPTGFVYQIEGSAQSSISTADISWRGVGVAEVTLGTLRYVKIPMGATASFRIVIHMEGSSYDEYRVVINTINYKLNPSDARYKKYDAQIATKMLKFR